MAEEKGYASLLGRQETVDRLLKAVKNDQISHAYIFQGEQGTGKKYMARFFAMAIQCEKHAGIPCMVCPSCKKALSRNHPDIIYITHEKPASIGVDEIRDQLVSDIEIKPYESEHKIYIVPDASKMTVQAQNALLKTLEEPPKYGCIMLLADNAGALLPTISSRCVTVDLKPVSDEYIKNFLMEDMLVPDYEAELQAAFAQGNIGKAKKLAASGDFYEKLQESLQYLKNSKELDTAARIELDKTMAADKQGIYDFLDIFEMWFRDVLYYKATRDTDNVIFKEEVNALAARAQVSSYEGIELIIDSIDSARKRLKANVSPELVLELLFLTIWEN